MAPSEAVRQERMREVGLEFYYRNLEKRQALARKFSAKTRARRAVTETPEQADERRRLNREWYKKNRQERVAKQNAYNAANRERFRMARTLRRRIQKRERWHSDPVYKMIGLLRAHLANAMRKARAKKSARTLSLVGCGFQALMAHIEEQWTAGMTWDNFGHGLGRWSLDHIKPCSAFRLLEEAEQRACFHYTNLRPLWWIENMKKNSHWNGRYWKHTDHACVPPAQA